MTTVVPEDIHRRFRRIGRALMRVNANNTHSGNLSLRDSLDPDRFYVTASGSQCGELTPRCIVPLRFSSAGWEGAKPSTESGIHRRILSLPGVNACVHCHSVAATAMSFDSPAAPVLGRRHRPDGFVFQPVDRPGALRLGPVPVGVYREAVGSAEMEERLPGELAQAPVAVVAGHGPFARGRSLESCLEHLSLLESSVTIATALRRRGLELAPLQERLLAEGPGLVFGPDLVAAGGGSPVEDPAASAEFRYWAAYHFNMGLGAFGTGSMSLRVSETEMIYCALSAAPEGFEIPLVRVPFATVGDLPGEAGLHAAVYAQTVFCACMITACPLAAAEGMAVLYERTEGGDSGAAAAGLSPIDVEGQYLYGRLGLAEVDVMRADRSPGRLASLLQNHRGCCVVAGYGVVAAGRSLAEAAHHVSSAERIARLRQEVFLNQRLFGGPALSGLER
jgi:ribulose-5-phosphate 4-epimerase/fuculose-1-phosphate aldolase